MNDKTPWIFVDCEARGTSPVHGVLTEFGAVHYDTRDSFHGRLFDATPDPDNPAISIVGERMATDKEVAERQPRLRLAVDSWHVRSGWDGQSIRALWPPHRRFLGRPQPGLDRHTGLEAV
jgi:DNA polymerase III epsilon subunit-like protein